MPNNAHSFVLQLTGRDKNVLELGAASGHVTAELTKRGNRVTAVEIDISNRDLLSQAAEKVIITDLDRLDLVKKLQGEKFDVIIAADVFEHLTRSSLVLFQLHELLKEDGYIVASIPNIAHGDVRLTMLQGNFPYAESGLLDKTHLQFFTRSSVKEFFNDNGFDITEIYCTVVPLGQTEIQLDLSTIDQAAVNYVRGSKDSDVYQFIIKAVPNEVVKISSSEQLNMTALPEITLERAQIEVGLLGKKMRIMENEKVVLENEKKNMQAEFTMQNLVDKDYLIGLLATVAEYKYRDEENENLRTESTDLLRAEMTKGYETGLLLVSEMTRADAAETLVLKLQVQVANIQRLQNELDALRQSRAFKIGRTITAPIRVLRRIFS